MTALLQKLSALVRRRSFHACGLLAALWPAFIAFHEIRGCAPHWESMCGTLMVFLNPVGLSLSMPLYYLELPVLSLLQVGKTAEYVVLVFNVMVVHYLVGGLLGVWVFGWWNGRKRA